MSLKNWLILRKCDNVSNKTIWLVTWYLLLIAILDFLQFLIFFNYFYLAYISVCISAKIQSQQLRVDKPHAISNSSFQETRFCRGYRFPCKPIGKGVVSITSPRILPYKYASATSWFNYTLSDDDDDDETDSDWSKSRILRIFSVATVFILCFCPEIISNLSGWGGKSRKNIRSPLFLCW